MIFSGPKGFQPSAHEVGLTHGEAADDYALHAGGEQGRHLGLVADAAAGLDAQAAVAGEFLHQRSLALHRVLGAIEVDDVQPGGAGGLEALAAASGSSP